MIATRSLGSVEMPQTVVENAQILASEVERVATDIDACKQQLPAAFYASWKVWHDTALALVEQVQKPAWYETVAGAQWTLFRQVFSGSGLREQMRQLVAWRNQAAKAGCQVSGPGPTVPPMPLSDKLMWGAIGVAGIALVGLVTYGVVTKRGPVQIINRIARK